MKKLIEYRIAELKKEKEEFKREYLTCSPDLKNQLATQNMDWSIELKFLETLMETYHKQAAGLLLYETPYEDLRSDIEGSLRIANDMKYSNYNTAGLILSQLKYNLEKRAQELKSQI